MSNRPWYTHFSPQQRQRHVYCPFPECNVSRSPFSRLHEKPHNLSFHHNIHKALHLFDADLHTALVTWRTLAQLWEQVGDVVPWMSVQTSAQSLLVEVMGNETDRTTEDKKTVEDTHLEVVLCLFGAEGARVSEEVDEADGNATVDVENEVVLLRGGDGFDGEGVVEELGGWEVLQAVFLDERDTEIGVVPRLDTVTNAGD